MKKLLYKKGYFIKVVSWENDGDYYRTAEVKVDDKVQGLAYQRICKTLFVSNHSSDLGLGNDYMSEIDMDRVHKFYDDDPYFTTILHENRENSVHGIIEDLMGESEEGYSCRVVESCIIFNVKEDCYLDTVEE